MSDSRLLQYLDEILQAANNARDFTSGMSLEAFRTDKRTQQAVVMSIVIIGEAAVQIMDRHPVFAAAHPDLPWQAMRGMRNRAVHGYFSIDLTVVWDTVQTALPDLLKQLSSVSK